MAEIIDRRISFNAGEISPWLDPRLDLDKYRMGCRTLQNMRPSVYGGAFGRSGTEYLGAAASAATAVRLIPFTREVNTNYILEFSDLKMRVWDAASKTLVASIAGAAWLTSKAYLPGDVLSQEGANYQVLTSHTSGTFDTDLAAAKLRLYPYQEIVTPYTAAQLDAIQSAQQNDVLFLAHASHFPRLIMRMANGTWRMSEINIDWPATLGPNLSLTTITPLVDIYNSGEPAAWTAGTYAAGTKKKGKAGGSYAANYYIATASTTTEPGTAAALGLWIEGRWINAAAPTVAGFDATKYYVTGELMTFGGKTYLRTSMFSGGAKGWDPLEDSGSTQLWDHVGDPAVESATGMVPKGKSIILKASAAIWDSAHVGTKWMIGQRRDDLKVSFYPQWQVIGYVTGALYVLGEWTLQINSSSTSAYSLELLVERSVDLVTWETHYGAQSEPNDVNQLLTGSEETPVFLRLKLQNKTGTVPSSMVAGLTAGNPTQHGIVQILSVTSSSQVEALVITPLYRYLPTTGWEEPAWCGLYGYPRAVTLHENRLFYGGTARKPTTVWGSAIDAYQDYRLAAADDRAVSYTLASDESSAIEWLVSQDMLVIGTSSGEWVMGMRPGDDGPKLRRNTSFGSAPIQARAIADALVFVQRSRRKVREFAWSFERDGYQANDLIMLSEHLGDAEFRQIAIQRNPESVVWVVTARGDLLSLTYERGQNVAGWARHVTDGSIESVAVVAGTGEEDHLWLAVKRTIGGAAVRYIERITPDQPRAIKAGELATLVYCDSARAAAIMPSMRVFIYGTWKTLPFYGYDVNGWPEWQMTQAGNTFRIFFNPFFSDPPNMYLANWELEVSGILSLNTTSAAIWGVGADAPWEEQLWPHLFAWSYSGLEVSATSDVIGLAHLEGETVAVLADGMPHRQMVVTGGKITLDRPATYAVAGLPYEAVLEPTFFETADPQSVTKQGRKRLMRASVQFWESLGCTVSVDQGVTWQPISFQDLSIPVQNALPLYTGGKDLPINSGTKDEISIMFKQSQPLPFNVMSIGARYTVEML